MKELNTMDDYLDRIYGRGNSGGKHSLEKIRQLLAHFDNPQDKIKVVHVAGTNGKGSTSRFMANTLSKTTSCGLFTSPYMTRINEAISISGEEISDQAFKEYIDKVRPVAEELDKQGLHNTYFEVLTAIMYMYFYDSKVDVAVVEVGLGGTVDCTNIIKKPIASVITTISKDHMNILGDTLEEIASNKAGIIKKGVPVFVYPQVKCVMDVIEEKAAKENAKIHTFTGDDIEILEMSSSHNKFSFRDYKNIETGLIGKHQIYNASLALMVLDYFKDNFELTEHIIRHAFYYTTNPGRLQLISENPRVIVDGSHNEQAIDALIESLKNFEYEKLILGFSVLKDKEHKHMIDKLSQVADEIVITKIDNPRAMKVEDIREEFKEDKREVNLFEDRIEAYEYSKKIAGPNDLVLWCGSLYLIGEFIKYEEEKAD